MANMIITGGTGFIAQRIYKNYFNEYNITLLGRKDMNLEKYLEVKDVLDRLKPDIIIHTAAMTSTQECEDNPILAYRINVDGALNIAKVANSIGSKMLFFSTEQVFNGNLEEGPYGETDNPIPSTVYGRTKLESEQLLIQEIEKLWIIRLSWLFGLPERNLPINTNLVWNLMKKSILNQPLKISDNEYRGITYGYELVNNLKKILELPYGIYHFGSINEKSTYEMAEFMLKEIGLPKERINKIIIKDELKYKNKKRDLRLSYDKINSFGIPICTSQESIIKAIKEYNLYL